MTHARRQAMAIATIVRSAFDRHQRDFAALTHRARRRFETRDWRGVHSDAAERLDLYARAVDRTVTLLRERGFVDREAWSRAKEAFGAITSGRGDQELAASFFNSTSRRVFSVVGQDPAIEYTEPPAPDVARDRGAVICRDYAGAANVATSADLIATVVTSFDLHASFRDLRAACERAAARIDLAYARRGGIGPARRIAVLRSLFFRNKGAYIIGHVDTPAGPLPLAIALVHPEAGVTIDAVLLGEAEVSRLFSLAHSYFHAEIHEHAATVAFLREMMPRRRVADLYIALGHNKHGKTEIYRALRRHLATTSEKLDFAPGRRGMVMNVFSQPSYDHVFKVIKDRFDRPKHGNRARVIANYRMVFHRDRVGRLVDAQEFEDLELSRHHFSDGLLAALTCEASEVVRVEGERVILKHVYMEVKVTPLDLYLEQALRPGEGQALRLAAALEAVLDYGAAIKNLAAAGIFPGDLFLKNFGVTKSGRVVFYDYDELCLLGDCVFRRIPKARNDEDELAAEPWYAVGENDVFPEEILPFLGIPEPLRSPFLAVHGDLFGVEFWHEMQRQHEQGAVLDLFPYPSAARLLTEVGAGRAVMGERRADDVV